MARTKVDPRARRVAENVLATRFSPDPVWVLDVCQTPDGEFHLLEIGGFSFANLYACDKDAVVQAVSQVAAEIHAARSAARSS